jgi:hypothetical protein
MHSLVKPRTARIHAKKYKNALDFVFICYIHVIPNRNRAPENLGYPDMPSMAALSGSGTAGIPTEDTADKAAGHYSGGWYQ